MNANKYFENSIFLKNKKFNGSLVIIMLISAFFIGLFYILPVIPFTSTSSSDDPLGDSEGSNSGFEELIRVSVDKYGNLSVYGSFQGPQVTPDVNWSLGYEDAILVQLRVANENVSDYIYPADVTIYDPDVSVNDVYLQVFYITDMDFFEMMGMGGDISILNDAEMLQKSQDIKDDIERVFGVQNNFSSNPIGAANIMGIEKIFTYGFNFSSSIDYDYFIQYFLNHMTSGLADSFTPTRINNTKSWLTWGFSNMWDVFGGQMAMFDSPNRFPNASFSHTCEANVYLQYPNFFGSGYGLGDYTFNLSEILNDPFSPTDILNESAFSTSEIDINIYNGEITSTKTAPYHFPRYLGLDHDYWNLQNATFYDTMLNSSGTVEDIEVNFSTNLLNLTFIEPITSIQSGNINITIQTEPSGFSPSGYICQIFDRNTYFTYIDDDYSMKQAMGLIKPLDQIPLNDMGGGVYSGSWDNSYRCPNEDYVIYAQGSNPNLSMINFRSRYSYSGGVVYNFTEITLNNPKEMELNITNPSLDDIVEKNVNITANGSSPNSITNMVYEIYNYTQYLFGYPPIPMVSGNLTWNGASKQWEATWDSTSVPSTEEYILRVYLIDTNTSYFKDIQITVNNTLYQENIPIFAPFGVDIIYSGFNLDIGSIYYPQVSGNPSGPPAMDHMFFGYGVDYGIDFTSSLYEDILAVFIMADNNHSTNELWGEFESEVSTASDIGITIMTTSDQVDVNAILDEIQNAFNIDTPTFLYSDEMYMGPGMVSTMHSYGLNYSSIAYTDFIAKFHSSVPDGLSSIYNEENMTQPELNSTILFTWWNPESGVIPINEKYKNYNFGYGATINPLIRFPDYFNSTIGTENEISLKKLLPQISQFNSCSSNIASTVLSGFGPTILPDYFFSTGLVASNANITDWYPNNGNVTPLYMSPNMLNVVSFTMLNTTDVPFGLINTDDIKFNLTGPFITNNILTPNFLQEIKLSNTNATVESQSITGNITNAQYYLHGIYNEEGYGSNLIYNGNNWTTTIDTSNMSAGYYNLFTMMQDNLTNGIMNSTIVYINNTFISNGLLIGIGDIGEVEIGGIWANIPSIGYGFDLGINITDLEEEYNYTQFYMDIASPNTSNQLSYSATGENWNVFVVMQYTSIDGNFDEMSKKIIQDLERAFNIEGLLQEIELTSESYGTDSKAWVMNYTNDIDYLDFLDHWENVLVGNSSNIFSKENMLKADDSQIVFQKIPEQMVKNGIHSSLGVPLGVDVGQSFMIIPIMKFNDVYDYSTLNQNLSFSLAEFMNISQINTEVEKGITYSYHNIYTQVYCGNYTNNEYYPYIPGLTNYLPGTANGLQFTMLSKQGDVLMGIDNTTDIQFNFTAPYTKINILSPSLGTKIHGNTSLIINATMIDPPVSHTNAEVSVYYGGTYDPIYSIAAPIQTFSIPYDPINKCWNGSWMTLKSSIPNGWYDIVFSVYDNQGRRQRNLTQVYVENTYYMEQMGVNVDQYGNISVNLQQIGNKIGLSGLNLSNPGYDVAMQTIMMAFNAYSGYENNSKKLLSTLGMPENDIICGMIYQGTLSENEALSYTIPIKDDFERIFGIEGNLTEYLFSPTFSMGGGGEMGILFFGANYSSSLNYEHFINFYHQSVPYGMNNTLPFDTINSTDGYIEWMLQDSSISGGSMPSSIFKSGKLSMVQISLNFGKYWGADYNKVYTSRNLSLTSLLNIPVFTHAPNTSADCLFSMASVITENANITSFYPPFYSQSYPDRASVTFCVKNQYMEPDFNYMIMDTPMIVDDVNLTFSGPTTRVQFINPLPGAIVDGTTDVIVQTINNTPADVYQIDFNVYTEEEYNKYFKASMMYGGSIPEGIYGSQSMVYNGTHWNSSWLAYQHSDGPIWILAYADCSDDTSAYNLTQVEISNSNPLSLDVLTPTDNDTLSDITTLSTHITNNTPIQYVFCEVKKSLDSQSIIETIVLEDQGGGIYSQDWGTYGIKNGKYLLHFQVMDAVGAVAHNYSVYVNTNNTEFFTVEIINPDDLLDKTPIANFTAIGSGPQIVKNMYFKIYQEYYMPEYNSWINNGLMAEGWMIDPDSTWIAIFDSSSWPTKIMDDWSRMTDAYYSIEIQAEDIKNTRTHYMKRFLLGEPAIPPANITFPNNGDWINGIVDVWVNVTDPGDVITSIEGELRRTSDNMQMTKIEFVDWKLPTGLINGTLHTYAFQNDNYTIKVWGYTQYGGYFEDSITVMFNNTQIFTIDIVNPFDYENVSGMELVELNINNITNLDMMWVDVFIDDFGNPGEHITGIWGPFLYDNSTGYWNKTWGTYGIPNGDYILIAGTRDINDVEINSPFTHININNTISFTVDIINPIDYSTLSNEVTIQLDINSPFEISYIQGWIFQDTNNLENLQDFDYNYLTGYYELKWASYKYWNDNNYRLEIKVEDINGTITDDVVYFSISNGPSDGIQYNLISPTPGERIQENWTYIMDVNGPADIKWVSANWGWGDNYFTYQGMINHKIPWNDGSFTGNKNSPQIIQLQNGSLMMSYSESGIKVALQYSGGWNIVYSQGIGYESAIYQLANGSIYLVYQDTGNLYLASSHDNGVNWQSKGSILLDNGTWSYGNPSLTQLSNGTVILAFEHECYSGPWESNIGIVKLDSNGNPYGFHYVLEEIYLDPSIIRTLNNEFVIAYVKESGSYGRLIYTSISNDNCTSFENETIVTHDCYHEWNWWYEPSIIQSSSNGMYLVIGRSENSPYGEFGTAAFVFNSSDRLHWGCAKPIENDTFYSNNYRHYNPSITELQNGSYLIAVENDYYNGIWFTRFDNLTEHGSWLLSVNTSLYPDDPIRTTSFTIEDVLHVEIYPKITNNWEQPDIENPKVIIIQPTFDFTIQEYESIDIVANITDNKIVTIVEVYVNGTYLMDLTNNGTYYTGIWSDTMGWYGYEWIQIVAWDGEGNVNATEAVRVIINQFIPSDDHADLYEVSITNSSGMEQTNYSTGETVEYHATVRGDLGGGTYIITAQTDDPLLNGYLQTNESVILNEGEDVEVIFNFDIPTGSGVPTGTYTVQILVWTDWPWDGGYCVDFIEVSYTVV